MIDSTSKKVSFSIFDSSGKKVETLQSCFIKRANYKRDNLPSQILAGDGLVYNAVFDCRIPATDRDIEFIISFQKHTFGNFAIIRLARSSLSNKLN